MVTKRIKPGAKITLKLTKTQVDLIVENPLIDDDLLASIYTARVWDGIVSIRCTLAGLDQLSGYVSAEANTAKNRELRDKLNAISDEIDRVNLSYVETELRQPAAAVAHPRLSLVKK